ncbi:uncharacterized protein LOC131071409 isoform X2 [Cryptomeria japonica]|uniref:uncharacterized protein LOC131071409 isoform X2 n=1 Tax=Cryptomeria japonica TaxID=3369 RepID=UPI0027D9D683|nr:uncharacterized protein LOC131071409 isoform X2 [Cryptomeria japonica]
MCVSSSGICSGVDDAAGANGSSSNLCMICGSRYQTHTIEDFALTDELMDMVFAHEPQTQDAATVSHTPPPVTIAATSMPVVLTGDEMSQIDDITLLAIDFGRQGYTGTPSTSRARPKKKDSSKTPKCRKKLIRPWIKRGRRNIHTYFINGEPSSLHWRSISRSGNSDSFYINGEPSSVHWRSISGTNPFTVRP